MKRILQTLSSVFILFGLVHCGQLNEVFNGAPQTSQNVPHAKKISTHAVSSQVFADVDTSQLRDPIVTKQGTYYFVQPNDTLTDIAKKFHTDEEEVAQINDLFESQLLVGRRLFIPNRRTRSDYMAVTKVIKENASSTLSSVEDRFKKAPSFTWPVEGIVTSPFSWRWGRHHDGLDISAKIGTPICAAEDGRVLFAQRFAGYGNLVVIKHAKNYFTAYAHASNILVGKGDKVKKGQKIAIVGSTGHSTGPHCHFEIRKNTEALDPLTLLPSQGNSAKVALDPNSSPSD